MFALAMKAAEAGKGVVGSTSNILQFIVDKAREGRRAGRRAGRQQFVLGTEAGMVTSIVRGVQEVLREGGREGGAEGGTEVEIVFPVASEAVAGMEEGGEGLTVVPGVKGGEGCSTAGGCATCPYMKMNSLDALLHVVEACPPPPSRPSPRPPGHSVPAALRPYLPPIRPLNLPSGRAVEEVGVLPIHHMQAMMQEGRLSQALVEEVLARAGGRQG
jgi:quinolinate synthase